MPIHHPTIVFGKLQKHLDKYRPIVYIFNIEDLVKVLVFSSLIFEVIHLSEVDWRGTNDFFFSFPFPQDMPNIPSVFLNVE